MGATIRRTGLGLGLLGVLLALSGCQAIGPVAHSPPLSAGILSIGAYHSCTLTPARAVDCWGNTSDGQAGNQVGTEMAGHSPQLLGTGDSYGDFTWSDPIAATLGSPLTSIAPLADTCVDPATRIHDVQGNGSASPVVGQSVTIQGIVVGDFQPGDGDALNNDLDGFYVQEAPDEYDADPNTSEGVFVRTGASALNVVPGDVVRVTGSVAELNGLTEIDARSGTIVDCGDQTLPAPAQVLLPFSGQVYGFETYEGMLVTLPQSLSIADYVDFDRFGEIAVCAPNPLDPLTARDRLYQPTSIDQPGSAGAAARAEYNQAACITVDDGRSEQYPDPARHPNGQAFTLTNRFRGGDIVQHTTGVLDYRANRYRVQPTTGAQYSAANPRPEQPPAVSGDLRVSSFSVGNYFTTPTTAGNVCGPARNQACRGANNPEEFERQRAKIIEALVRLNADIVGLIELDNTDDVAIENLVAGLNTRFGATTYASIDTGTIGSDAIRVALIYKPARVTPVGAFETLDSVDDPRFIDTRNRPALAQTFERAGSDARFTAVVNHFTSRGSDCGGPPDDDPHQGNCNGTRTQAAEALVDWLAGDPTGSNDPDVLIIGDLNAYDQENPIAEIRAGADDTPGTADDYSDLALQFGGEYAYSDLIDGQFGYLDYALAITSLVPQLSGARAWHINADEPDILDYDTTNKQPAQDALYDADPFRSADHDPVLVGLDLVGTTPPTDTATPSPMPSSIATPTAPPPLPARVWLPLLGPPVVEAPRW